MVYSVISSIIFFTAAVIWLVRFAGEAGARLPQNRILGFITADKTFRASGEKTERSEYAKIFAAAMAFRILFFLFGWLAKGIMQYGNVPGFLDYCKMWLIGDGQHYIEIASNGYSHFEENGQHLMLVFFPMYPLLMRIFHWIIPNYVIAAMIVSALCYSAGCAVMYKLVAIDYSKSIARMSIIFMSVYPYAMYYGGVLTESLFLLTIVSTFLAIRQHKWLLAGILGAFASLTRSFGMFMIIPAAVEWVQTERPLELIRDKKWETLGKKIMSFLPALTMILGILIYLFINYKVAGDPFVFMQYERDHWLQKLQFFGKTSNMLWNKVFHAGSNWTSIACMYLPELLSFITLSLVILYSTRRTRSMYVIFMLIYFAFNAGASWPLSMSRYWSCMFPMFWVAAEFTDTHKKIETPLAAIMAIMLGMYLVGYMNTLSLM